MTIISLKISAIHRDKDDVLKVRTLPYYDFGKKEYGYIIVGKKAIPIKVERGAENSAPESLGVSVGETVFLTYNPPLIAVWANKRPPAGRLLMSETIVEDVFIKRVEPRTGGRYVPGFTEFYAIPTDEKVVLHATVIEPYVEDLIEKIRKIKKGVVLFLWSLRIRENHIDENN